MLELPLWKLELKGAEEKQKLAEAYAFGVACQSEGSSVSRANTMASSAGASALSAEVTAASSSLSLASSETARTFLEQLSSLRSLLTGMTSFGDCSLEVGSVDGRRFLRSGGRGAWWNYGGVWATTVGDVFINVVIVFWVLPREGTILWILNQA
jgi:hypothetical protein